MVGRAKAKFCPTFPEFGAVRVGHVLCPTYLAALMREFWERENGKIDALLNSTGSESGDALKARIQELMTAKVGIFRTGKLPA